jgi:T5SS/PEP-CTERM-associated repeat protein
MTVSGNNVQGDRPMAAPVNVRHYTGHGQSGLWSDPANWANGLVPGIADTALIQQNAVLNGPIDVGTIMLLGTETVTINSHITTESTNTCESFMVCDQAVANFTPGSSLTDHGGFEVGVDAIGHATIAAGATVTSAVMKIGQFAPGIGTLNLAGSLTNTGGAYVGLYGNGTLNVTGAGQASFAGLVLGENSGAVGALNLSGTASVHAGFMVIGANQAGTPGGVASVNISGSATLASDHTIAIGEGSTVSLAGGTLSCGAASNGLQINQGAALSGHGTILAASHGVTDNGVLTASGGTLAVTGTLFGTGVAQIAAGATLDLVSSKITVPSIAFLGSNAALDLSAGVGGTVTITGFGAGDQLVMSGIDQASWSGSAHVLTLSEHGQIMDKLHLPDIAASATFQENQGIVTLLPAIMNHP